MRHDIRHAFGQILAGIFLALCTSTLANAPATAVKSPAVLAAEQYIDCAVGFVKEHAVSANSATEAVEGALGKCSSHLIDYQNAERDYFSRSNPLEAEYRGRVMREQLESTVRQKLIAYALQLRSEA